MLREWSMLFTVVLVPLMVPAEQDNHDHHGGDAGKRTPAIECLNSTFHKMPNGTVMRNDAMNADLCVACVAFPCGSMVCLNATHHRMSNGVVTLNTDILDGAPCSNDTDVSSCRGQLHSTEILVSMFVVLRVVIVALMGS
eukprot:TRINITY_DN13146_c0_g2_i1.p2 TRINITY_DN13146_c0_g2~~TRINITY_DN13146_c0_g2_i1.p2  ORF type:complete len:158 (-),score=17.22 TRINITY_DN13146_c0_g2_i1:262-681(-)